MYATVVRAEDSERQGWRVLPVRGLMAGCAALPISRVFENFDPGASATSVCLHGAARAERGRHPNLSRLPGQSCASARPWISRSRLAGWYETQQAMTT
eukprot:1689523-Rhodomonas_salina.2